MPLNKLTRRPKNSVVNVKYSHGFVVAAAASVVHYRANTLAGRSDSESATVLSLPQLDTEQTVHRHTLIAVACRQRYSLRVKSLCRILTDGSGLCIFRCQSVGINKRTTSETCIFEGFFLVNIFGILLLLVKAVWDGTCRSNDDALSLSLRAT